MLINVNMTDTYLTPQEIAATLKVSYMTVYRWIRAGKLNASRAGKQYRIKDKDLIQFMQRKKPEEIK